MKQYLYFAALCVFFFFGWGCSKKPKLSVKHNGVSPTQLTSLSDFSVALLNSSPAGVQQAGRKAHVASFQLTALKKTTLLGIPFALRGSSAVMGRLLGRKLTVEEVGNTTRPVLFGKANLNVFQGDLVALVDPGILSHVYAKGDTLRIKVFIDTTGLLTSDWIQVRVLAQGQGGHKLKF